MQYSRFKQILVDTALEAVETQEGAKIAPGKVKFLSMPYKGVVQPAIVRETGGKKSKASHYFSNNAIFITRCHNIYRECHGMYDSS